MTVVDIRPIQSADPNVMASCFAAIGWSKPVALFERYLHEQTAGSRVVLVARVDDCFAGYVTLCWTSDYPPARTNQIPEIQDLNVLPEFRRRRVASALLDRVEALAAERSNLVAIGVGLHPGYNAAQRLYGLRGYEADGNGVTYRNQLVVEGQTVLMDDHLVLHFVKRLNQPHTLGLPVGVVLNGASSSGKTSVAQALRDLLGPAWVALSIDDLFRSLHPDRPSDWKTFHLLTQTLFDSAATFGRLGFSFVVDTVFERPECYRAYQVALSAFPTLFVSLNCPVAVLAQRETLRADRGPGLAAEQAARVHEGYRYDVSLDTSVLSPQQCAATIREELQGHSLIGAS